MPLFVDFLIVKTVRLVEEGLATIHTELYGYSFEAVTNKDRWRG